MKFFQEQSPSSGTITALGIYILASLFFVVIGWIEFAVVLYLNRCNKDLKQKETHSQENDFKLEAFLANKTASVEFLGKDETLFNIRRIDKAALYCNTFIFLLFNLFYWLKFKFMVL